MSERLDTLEDAKRIPIAAAKRIAEEYGYDQVVIFARAHRTDNKEHVTTYGKTVEDCDVAARMGNQLKRAVGWPESKCQDKPARISGGDGQYLRLRFDGDKKPHPGAFHPTSEVTYGN